MKFKNLVLIIIVPAFFLCACRLSQAQLDATATQEMADLYATQTAVSTATPLPTNTTLPTPLPTNTPLPTPTIIPGKFLSPPEYLETTFFPDGFWQTNPQGIRTGLVSIGDTEFEGNKIVPVISYVGDSVIKISAPFFYNRGDPIDPGMVDKFIDCLPLILDNYLVPSTQEKIFQFMQENSEMGSYKTEIDLFIVIYEPTVFEGSPVLNLTIWQES